MIKIRDEVAEPTPQDNYHTCLAQTFFNPEKSYIIIGGLGGFGLEVAKWMVQRGATKLVLTSRSGVKNGYQSLVLSRLRENTFFKTQIVVSNKDCLTQSSASSLIDEAQTLGPLGGVFMLAMVLKDSLFENQSKENFELVYGSKGRAGIYLDKLTRERSPHLDYFVCFSSLACGRGNPGQTNYAYANSVLERICEKRRRDGLHGIAIQWGALGDVGYVSDLEIADNIEIAGSVPQRLPSFFKVLDKFLLSSHTVVCSIVLADSKKLQTDSSSSLIATIFHVLGVKDPYTLDPNISLLDLGMDSLMTVEIKQGLEREFDVSMSSEEIRNLKVKDIFKLQEQTKANKINSQDKETGLSPSGFKILETAEDSFKQLSDLKGNPIFCLPSIECDLTQLISLANALSRPLININWTSEFDSLKTIEEVAELHVDKLFQNYPNCLEFDLIGLAYGGVIALEMANVIQKNSREVKNLVLLDSSPDLVKLTSNAMLIPNTVIDKNFAHVEVLMKLLNYMILVENVDELKSELIKMKSDQERCLKLVQIIQAKSKQTVDALHLNQVSQRYLQKLSLIHEYTPKRCFNGDVKLIRCLEENKNNLDNDYGLSKVS